MKILYKLDEELKRIEYIKECTKNLKGTWEICGGVYVFDLDKTTAEQSIIGTMTILQEYCEFLCINISELQDGIKVLIEDVQKIAEGNKEVILCRK